MNEQESKFSRRDFFKGAVASGVAATTVGLMAGLVRLKQKGRVTTPPFHLRATLLGTSKPTCLSLALAQQALPQLLRRNEVELR